MKKTHDEKKSIHIIPSVRFYRGGKPIEDKRTPEERKRFLAWAWFMAGDFSPELDDAECTGVLDGVGPLQSLLLPLIMLQEMGNADRYREVNRELQEAAEKIRNIVDKLPSLYPEGSFFEKEWKAQFDRLSEKWQRTAARMERAEESLKKAGWRFDSKTRRLKRFREGEGKDLLTECVWAIYATKHQEEYRKATKAKQRSIRRKIGEELSPYFDSAELSAESGAPIYMTIWKGENPTK
jgi:hypothetical protein